MEPATLTAAAIATLVIVKAFEKTGEIIGEKAWNEGEKLLVMLRRKQPSTANAVELAQTQPLDYGQASLVEQVEEAAKKDPEIAQAVEAVASEAQTQVTQPKLKEMINQIVIKGVQVKGKAKVGDIEIEAARDGSVNQEAVVDSEFGDDLDLGNINLKA
ncbi:hypothetical protein [Tolypothrix sp. VBCCA 56010]|uniref:hypothetical protein n=1 Tax=Tolypothrix sp. VBCCA 56010 TaxID=3137731 RepID=UPI003D7CE704